MQSAALRFVIAMRQRPKLCLDVMLPEKQPVIATLALWNTGTNRVVFGMLAMLLMSTTSRSGSHLGASQVQWLPASPTHQPPFSPRRS
jgi:hypothetical protein